MNRDSNSYTFLFATVMVLVVARIMIATMMTMSIIIKALTVCWPRIMITKIKYTGIT